MRDKNQAFPTAWGKGQNIARIANAAQCLSQLKGHNDCHKHMHCDVLIMIFVLTFFLLCQVMSTPQFKRMSQRSNFLLFIGALQNYLSVLFIR